jgi:glycosyltransferase involved in cell wall biosynthesis
MIIGIDGRSLIAAKTGIGVYTDRLLRGLAEKNGLSIKMYLPMPFLNPRKRTSAVERIAAGHPGAKVRVHAFPVPEMQNWIWGRFDLPAIETYLGKIDLFHATSFVMPPLKRAKGVMTVYDLTFMLFPEYHSRGTQTVTRDIQRYIDRSDCIIAISEHTKRDIVERLKVPEHRILVTLLAADERYRVINDRACVKTVMTRYGIDREYILYTGTLEPRKNIPALIRSFHVLKQEMKIPHLLVLAGRKGWLYESIFEEVGNLGMASEVVFTGYVPDDDLPFLYNGADLFVYPSLYEGFGLPPLEAMACGCPTVTSDSSSLPEVVGDAGLMVNPNSSADLVEAMARVLMEPGLAEALRNKGLARAARFSWDRCVQETLDIYSRVTGK